MANTYVEKPRTVEAMQFTGGADSGPAIVSWIIDHMSTAVWFDALDATDTTPARTETLMVGGPNGNYSAEIGDYIVLAPTGIFVVMDQATFEQTYAAS